MKGVTLTWAGGEHDFALTIELLRALQQRCDAGPAWILARLASGQWRIDDVVATIRFGLEGGGMDKAEAGKLINSLVDGHALGRFVDTAHAILLSALYDEETGGDEEDSPGEGKAATG